MCLPYQLQIITINNINVQIVYYNKAIIDNYTNILSTKSKKIRLCVIIMDYNNKYELLYLVRMMSNYN